MEQDVSIPRDLGDLDVERVRFDTFERDDEGTADAVPARLQVRAEELLAARVELEPALRLVAAGERLPALADRIEPARGMHEIGRLALGAHAGEVVDGVAAARVENREPVADDGPGP
jgi:hypothetical protein